MARLTIIFGIILMLLGVFTYMGTGSMYPTSLIPAYFGAVLAVLGALSRTIDLKKRGLYMHIAVTVGLLGFLGTAKSIFDYIRMKQGVQFKLPLAVEEKASMATLLLVYVLLCVQSFISARRARTQGQA